MTGMRLWLPAIARVARSATHPRTALALVGTALVAALSCSAPSPAANPGSVPDALRYLDDASFRRTELSLSLVNPSNGYSEVRLAHYATGDANDWDRLPEWNPPVDVIGADELDASGGAVTTRLSAAAAPLPLPVSVASLDDPALVELGKAAFERYPTQPAPYFSAAVTSRAAASQYGLWVDAERGVGGLVRARMADGTALPSLTCSSCHEARGHDGALAPGLPNAALNMGAAILAAGGLRGAPPAVDPIAAWGPGRVDVTTTAGTEPARIPDLRPVRFLTHLQQDATVRATDVVALAIRIETLIITSNESALRPPRLVALALAAYVTSLADGLPSADAASRTSPHGADVFASRCTGCHAAPGLTGAPVALDVVGTDPTLGRSASRGTGTYRVPSLHGVGSRGPLLHDGTLASVDAMLDPGRLSTDFTGGLHGAGAVPGHPFGFDLSSTDRDALLAYLRAL
jgi:cytochrome c5